MTLQCGLLCTLFEISLLSWPCGESTVLTTQMGWVTGKAVVTNRPNHPGGPASFEFVMFQRVDCPKCVIGLRTDNEGCYSVFLSAGRYRLVLVEGERLLPGQRSEVTVVASRNPTSFDFEFEIVARK